MAMPEVAKQIHARGLKPSMFEEPGESWTAGARGLGRGVKHFVKDDRPGKYQSQKKALPVDDQSALWQLEMAEFEGNLTPARGAVAAIDEVTFGVPHGMVDLARNTASAVGDIAAGEYEQAGEKLTGAGIMVLTHLGVKAWKHVSAGLDARRQAGARGQEPADTASGLKGPEGPGQFHILKFEGPITLEEARLGAIFALNPEAQAAMGRLLSRIGRDGVEKAAALVQVDSRAALFVAEHGEVGVYALLEAEGNVTAAATKLPSRQLSSGPSQRNATSSLDLSTSEPRRAEGARQSLADLSTPAVANAGPRSTPAALVPAEVDASVARIKASSQVTGDMNVLDGIARRAKLGEEGALGKLEAVHRWIGEGRSVEVLTEVQNEVLSTGKARTNPDYRVDGTVTEIKTRSKKFPEPGQGGRRSRDWIKHEISEANKQVRNSKLMEQGQVELQLRGQAEMPLSEIERNVRGNFSGEYGKSLKRVAVYQDSTLVGEWIRHRDGMITRTFPPPGESK